MQKSWILRVTAPLFAGITRKPNGGKSGDYCYIIDFLILALSQSDLAWVLLMTAQNNPIPHP